MTLAKTVSHCLPFLSCYGGGGGVLATARAEPLRLKAFELKRRQVDATGADHFVTSCGQCRLQFTKGAVGTNRSKISKAFSSS